MKRVLRVLAVVGSIVATSPGPAGSQSTRVADFHHENGIQIVFDGAAGAHEPHSPSPRISFLVVAVLLEGVIFLLPGVALSSLLDSYHSLDEMTFICASFVGSGAIGYLVFWVYLFSTHAGRTLSIAALATATVFVTHSAWRGRLKTSWLLDIAALGLLMALVSLFYLSLGFLYRHSNDPLEQAQLRFLHPLPSDNTIPYILADKLYHSQPVRPFLIGEWKSSDRPPLQAGLALMQFPLWSAKNRELDYQILGTFVQCMWLAAVWTVLQSLAVDGRMMTIVFAFCIFSGFFLVHSYYVWPKLLAASYFIFAVSLLHFMHGKARRCTPCSAALAGSAVALALLSHGGVAFSIIALGIALLATRDLPPARTALAGLLAASLFLLPWMIYQKLYDPPGDRLLKWHLAGMSELDSRPFSQLLRQAYTRPGSAAILRNKLTNVETLFGHLPPVILDAHSAQTPAFASTVAWYKEGTFFYLFPVLGVLNLGFPAFFFSRGFAAKLQSPSFLPMIERLFLLPIISIVVWCLLMYTPGSTLVHQGSLADVVILLLCLAVYLMSAAPRLTCVLLGFQLFVLFPLFALSEVFIHSQGNTAPAQSADRGMIVLSVVSLMALGTLGWRTGFVRTDAFPEHRGGAMR